MKKLTALLLAVILILAVFGALTGCKRTPGDDLPSQAESEAVSEESEESVLTDEELEQAIKAAIVQLKVAYPAARIWQDFTVKSLAFVMNSKTLVFANMIPGFEETIEIPFDTIDRIDTKTSFGFVFLTVVNKTGEEFTLTMNTTDARDFTAALTEKLPKAAESKAESAEESKKGSK